MDARAEDRRGRGMAFGGLLGLACMVGAGCRGAGEDTDRMVPRGWRGNPWGPKANLERATGAMPSVPHNADMVRWEQWGKRTLRDGDILFRMGDARAAMGLFPFSKVSAAIAESRFSHSGIVAVEGGEVVVYDTTTTGPQRQPLVIWLLDARGSVGVKRPRPEYQQYAQGAVAFCRAVYQKQTPFDWSMKMGDDHLYCIELTERAYEASGLPLSKPIRLDELPGYDTHPLAVRIIKLATAMVPDQLAYVIGNEKIGIWSSPRLEPVYDATGARPPGSAPEILPAEARAIAAGTSTRMVR